MTPGGQPLRYLVVGVWNTVFGYGLFAALQWTLGHAVHYTVILTIAQVVATVNAFICYRLLVFKVRGNVLLDFWRFSLVYIGAYLLNLAALPLLVEGLGMGVLVAQALVVAATVVASFFMHRDFSFRRSSA